MITKEELEKLIEEKATIYYYGLDYRLDSREEHHTDFWYKQLFEITENGLHYIYEDSDCYADRDTIFNFKDLYKTKEDAKFALKYTNIKRPEILNLPTWEEIQKIKEFIFYSKSKKYTLSCYGNIFIFEDDKFTEFIFDSIGTKENYINACDLCVKLFKGEEV